ncbi:hypothetical protein KAJ83_10430 [Marivibrio halodurans]|uniref:Uncharacterized protein n=1 Tax=Marivibrio halodurans TaxID=2039722 RepID=A0A8J7S635_9PROT|nr:hypothetical protein [Marivibrio halodurans]MBP5857424.1 hypothetical protein [Marivibrio halodurans]
MVGISEPASNLPPGEQDDLSALFETLADWEHQLQKLAPEDRAFIENEMEEPTP